MVVERVANQRPSVDEPLPSRQLTLGDWFDQTVQSEAARLLALKQSMTNIERIRWDFRQAQKKVLRGIQSQESVIGMYRALGRCRERMVALEKQLADVHETLRNICNQRADLVRTEFQVAADVRNVLRLALGIRSPRVIRDILEANGLPTDELWNHSHRQMTEVLLDTSNDDDEPNGAVAGMVLDWDDDEIDGDEELDELELEDWWRGGDGTGDDDPK